jgi:hypothetical protein
MTGGGTSDVFVVSNTGTTDRTIVITNFNSTHDAIGLFGYGAQQQATAAALSSASIIGGDMTLKLTDGTNIVFLGVPVLGSSNIF